MTLTIDGTPTNARHGNEWFLLACLIGKTIHRIENRNNRMLIFSLIGGFPPVSVRRDYVAFRGGLGAIMMSPIRSVNVTHGSEIDTLSISSERGNVEVDVKKYGGKW